MPPLKETAMYETHCKAQFEAILAAIADHKEDDAETRKEVKMISDRLFKTNGKRSILNCIEDNKKALDRHIEDSARPMKTVKRLSVGMEGLKAEGYSGKDVVKILLFSALFLYVVIRDHGPKVVDKYFNPEPAAEVTR